MRVSEVRGCLFFLHLGTHICARHFLIKGNHQNGKPWVANVSERTTRGDWQFLLLSPGSEPIEVEEIIYKVFLPWLLAFQRAKGILFRV